MTNLAGYTDPNTGLIGLNLNTTGRDCDNHLLFTATAKVVFGMPEDEFKRAVELCRLSPGVFTRYPSDPEPTSWDDLLGLSVASSEFASEILTHAMRSDWTWGDKWLGRIPLLVPVVLAGAGVKLSLWNKLRAAVCYVQNAYEPYGETSGACMAYLASGLLDAHGGVLSAAIAFWRWRMAKKYPGGMREVYAIYFKPDHPFAVNGPVTF